MNSVKLKEAMNQIHMKEEMQEEIIMNVKKEMSHRQYQAKRLKKTAVAAAVSVLIIGAAIPVQAGIQRFVQERLEHIPKQELDAVNETIQTQKQTEADNFTREYSSQERSRFTELETAYQNGTFPKQTILQKDHSQHVPEDSLCYLKDTGTFHLPERTLTDEELLQIIDFRYTQEYALAQSPAAQKAQELQESKENSLKSAIQADGGITGQEAQKAAESYLQTEFGLSAEGMESDIFLDETPDHTRIYHVSFQGQDDTYLFSYGIAINAADGSLVDTSHASIPKDPDLLKK